MKNVRQKSSVKAVSLNNEVIVRLEEEAEKENRTVSNYVETVLRQKFKEVDTIVQMR